MTWKEEEEECVDIIEVGMWLLLRERIWKVIGPTHGTIYIKKEKQETKAI